MPDIATSTVLAGELSLTFDPTALTLTVGDHGRGHRLAILPLAGSFAPVLAGGPASLRVTGVERIATGFVVDQAGPGLTVRTTWQVVGDQVEVGTGFTVAGAGELNRLDLLPAGTALNLWDVVNYRNRHHCPEAWPELLCGGKGFATDTASTDWQFAPHPTMLILRKNTDHLFFGALDLTTAYGLHLQVAENRVGHCHLDYGSAGHGLHLAAGTTFTAPRFALFLDRRGSVEATLARWTGRLIAQGAIPDPRARPHHAWHTEPLYCTWVDQWARAAIAPPAELQEQTAAVAPAVRMLDAALVREALAVIRRERLPFRTILIDAGWQVANGDWRAHPVRFPDLRGLVDEIHAAGMKAVVWWAWAEIASDVAVEPGLLIGGGKLNRHRQRAYDYASPEVQRRYLEPLIRRLLSSEAGCYDFDGVKTDFMADKVHADMPPGDPAWRGEENYFFHLYGLLQTLMRRHKPDACHHGYAGHPWLSGLIEVNRTADVFSTDPREHECRGRMLEATSPGCPVSLDFHCYRENFDAWIELGRRRGWSFQHGNILSMRQDPMADWEPADAAFLKQIRDGLTPR